MSEMCLRVDVYNCMGVVVVGGGGVEDGREGLCCSFDAIIVTKVLLTMWR